MAWAPDYVTLLDLKNYLRVEDDVDEATMDLAISAASRAIDKACNRQFGKDAAPASRYYTAAYSRADRAWTVPIDDLMDTTGLLVGYDQGDDQTYSGVVTARRLLPLNAPVQNRPFTSLRISSGVGATQYGVKVTGLFGWNAVPFAIQQAAMLQASRFIARRDSPYGIAGSPDVGSELRLLSKLDPDVEVSIAPYRRNWWVAR